MLWAIGGLISFLSLRKRNRRMAYKTFLLGILIPVVFFSIAVLVASNDDSQNENNFTAIDNNKSNTDNDKQKQQRFNLLDGDYKATFVPSSYIFLEVNPDMTDSKIRQSALNVPFDALVKYRHSGEIIRSKHYDPDKCITEGVNTCDRFVGNLVYNSGNFNSFSDLTIDGERVVRMYISLTDNTCKESHSVQVVFKPSPSEIKWLQEMVDSRETSCQKQERNISFYGTHVGFVGKSYGERLSPLIYAHIVEPVTVEKKQVFSNNMQHYTISVDNIPSYVDIHVVERGVTKAVDAWNKGNTVKFTIVQSNGDVNIEWGRGGAGMSLGKHMAQVSNDGTRTNQRIHINLGGEDCSSKYQQFGSNSLKHTIAHELGHFLGLRHIGDPNHLMHGGGFSVGDHKSVFDDLGHVIPNIDKPDVKTIKGQSTQSEILLTFDKLETLNNNVNAYNSVVKQLENLEDEYACQGGK